MYYLLLAYGPSANVLHSGNPILVMASGPFTFLKPYQPTSIQSLPIAFGYPGELPSLFASISRNVSTSEVQARPITHKKVEKAYSQLTQQILKNLALKLPPQIRRNCLVACLRFVGKWPTVKFQKGLVMVRIEKSKFYPQTGAHTTLMRGRPYHAI